MRVGKQHLAGTSARQTYTPSSRGSDAMSALPFVGPYLRGAFLVIQWLNAFPADLSVVLARQIEQFQWRRSRLRAYGRARSRTLEKLRRRAGARGTFEACK